MKKQLILGIVLISGAVGLNANEHFDNIPTKMAAPEYRNSQKNGTGGFRSVQIKESYALGKAGPGATLDLYSSDDRIVGIIETPKFGLVLIANKKGQAEITMKAAHNEKAEVEVYSKIITVQ